MKRHIRLLGLLGLLSLLSLFTLSAQLGSVDVDWTADMASSKIPTGVTLADVDTLDAPYTNIRFEIDIDATTCDNATKATAFNCVGDALQTAIQNDWMIDVWGIDTSIAATAVIVIRNIERTWNDIDDINTTDKYLVAEDVFRCHGVFRRKPN